jgi:hypothetical protein
MSSGSGAVTGGCGRRSRAAACNALAACRQRSDLAAVERVADDGMAEPCQVGTHLVRDAAPDLDRHRRTAPCATTSQTRVDAGHARSPHAPPACDDDPAVVRERHVDHRPAGAPVTIAT